MPRIERTWPYLQVATQLRQQITEGMHAPDRALPSIRELATEWGVSEVTMQKALRVLKEEGLVESRPGVGIVVRASRTACRAQDRYSIARRTGRMLAENERSEITTAVADAPADVRAALNLSEGAQAIRRHRVIFRDDAAVETCNSWFPATVAEAAPRLLDAERIDGGSGRYLAEALGKSLTYAEETITARLATPQEAGELAQSEPLAVLVVRHAVVDADGEPLIYDVGVHPAGTEIHIAYSVD